MSSISGLMNYVRYQNSQEVKGTVESRQTNLKQPRNDFVVRTEPLQAPPAELADERDKPKRRSADQGDRRKLCRRIMRQSVMVDFRSSNNRRRRHQREDDVVVHVSIKV